MEEDEWESVYIFKEKQKFVINDKKAFKNNFNYYKIKYKFNSIEIYSELFKSNGNITVHKLVELVKSPIFFFEALA